jgi:LacI family transcriptional regulator
MVDVARHAGVSLKTVSRVINKAPHVQQALVDRVLTSADELGFRRNRLASTLRSGQLTATIGLLIEEIANPFYATIAGVAADVARAHDTLLITASSEEDPEREAQLLRDLCSRRVDGLLVVPAGHDQTFLRSEVEMGIPVVFLDRPAGGLVADTVLLDNRGGARAGVRSLLDEGHRRIGILLDSLDVYTMRERLSGAKDALRSARVPFDRSLVRERVGDPAAAASAVADMLRRPDPPTALFCLNNRITVGAVQELTRLGNDAGLVGFDDFELSHLMPRPFRVIAYDTREMARQAAELLFERIDGRTTDPVSITLPTHLLTRGLPSPSLSAPSAPSDPRSRS